MDPQDHDTEIVALLSQHQSALRFYVASLLPGDPAVADVAQEANSAIWTKRKDFEIGTNFKAWMFSIARFEVLKFRKQQAREAMFVFSEGLEATIAEELPAHPNDFEERQLALRHCLEKLKPADRELIQHRYFQRTSLADYAAQLGRSVSGLKVALHRIRNRLQVCIARQLAVGEEVGK